MKWFNLSLALMALVLAVMLVVEPFVLARIGPSKADGPPRMPSSVVEISTLSELSTPLPAISTLKKKRVPKVRRAIAKETAKILESTDNPSAIAQTQALKISGFVETPIKAGDEPSVAPVTKIEPVPNLPSQAVEPIKQSAVVVAPPRCFRYGPLTSFSKVQAVGDKLVKEFELIKWGEAEEGYTETRHWIVLDSAQTVEQTRVLVKQLDSKGFPDHYLPLASDEPHLVSLGIFKDRNRADRHLASLSAAGFDAQLRDRQLEFSRRWLTFETATPMAELAEFVGGLGGEAVLEACPGGVENL
ncbi:MAG: hypothetical protein KUG54_01335 [Gammaproteobacteria bacterium]|nr:hypothetical protein [Gammaproteobacteria bacterium]